MIKKRNLIISIILTLVIAVGVTLSVILCNPSAPPTIPPSQNESENDGESTNTEDNSNVIPTLTVDSLISLDLLQQNYQFSYNVSIEGFDVSVEIVDTNIASISSSNIITPISVGSTKIITSINTTPATYKETTLIINDCVREANFSITNTDSSVPNVFYSDTDYILCLSLNVLDATPHITTQISNLSAETYLLVKNIKHIELIKVENNTYFYKFKIATYGKFSFEYYGKYITKSIENSAYIFPTNFNISFSNNVLSENIVNLYIFNREYTNEANLDGYFNFTTFQIIPEANTYDDIVLKGISKNNIVSISNTTITALNEGSVEISFYSNISKTLKTYTIAVQEIRLTSLLINNAPVSLESTFSIELNFDEEYDFCFLPSPTYAICNLIPEFNNQEIEYSQNKVTILSNVKNSPLKILNDSHVVYTLYVSIYTNVDYTINLRQATCECTFDSENKLLVAHLNSYPLAQLKFTAINKETKEPLPNQYFVPTITNNQICEIGSISTSSGNVDIKILETGTTTLAVYDATYENYIYITIIVYDTFA